ncbi:thymidylate kinase [Spirochaetia bacterium]|nr:thymidylate kinase [Spirochaetia bacterium]
MAIIHNFVVFEGGDGTGTSTQLGLLHKRFAAGMASAGDGDVPTLPPLHATFEPTDGSIGTLIRSALRGNTSLQDETVARLFAADRNEHLYGPAGIKARCERGELVVSDRYVLSSLVYQGITCGDDLPVLLNKDFPLPEMLFFFDLEPETALRRLESRLVKDTYEYLDFQVLVRQRYKALLPGYVEAGVTVTEIDASLPPEEVADAVWSVLEKMPILRGCVNTGQLPLPF